jgi:predicted RNA-binding protein associated with RNAse of E/G family
MGTAPRPPSEPPAQAARTREQITEVKTTLAGRVDRFVCDVAARTADEVIVLYRVPATREVHGVRLPAGTMTVGYFWTARPFNLYHWVGPHGRTLAHYFNVGDVTRLDRDLLEWHDLAVDVLATPDGRVQVLDEDELPADLAPTLRRYVEAARDRVLRDLSVLIAESEARSAGYLPRPPQGLSAATSPPRRTSASGGT